MKYAALNTSKKIQLLMRLNKGASVWHLSEEHGVGTSTFYDVKNRKNRYFHSTLTKMSIYL